MQQNSCHGSYITKNLVGIKEAFGNLAQATAEDRTEVTNLTAAIKYKGT